MKKAYSITEFIEAYSVKRSSVYKEMQSGRLRFFKVGKLTRISAESAEEWVRESGRGPHQERAAEDILQLADRCRRTERRNALVVGALHQHPDDAEQWRRPT